MLFANQPPAAELVAQYIFTNTSTQVELHTELFQQKKNQCIYVEEESLQVAKPASQTHISFPSNTLKRARCMNELAQAPVFCFNKGLFAQSVYCGHVEVVRGSAPAVQTSL